MSTAFTGAHLVTGDGQDYDGLVIWLNDLTRLVGAEALARQSRIPESERSASE